MLLPGIYAVIQFAALIPPPATAVECNLAVNINNRTSAFGAARTAEWTPAEVPAGTYFAVLKAGDQRETRKIVLAR